MTHTVKLPSSMADCPTWWKNYTKQFKGDPLLLAVNMHRRKMKVDWEGPRNCYILTFEDEQSCVMFKLEFAA